MLVLFVCFGFVFAMHFGLALSYVTESVLGLTVLFLPQPPKCVHIGVCHMHGFVSSVTAMLVSPQ